MHIIKFCIVLETKVVKKRIPESTRRLFLLLSVSISLLSPLKLSAFSPSLYFVFLSLIPVFYIFYRLLFRPFFSSCLIILCIPSSIFLFYQRSDLRADSKGVWGGRVTRLIECIKINTITTCLKKGKKTRIFFLLYVFS